MLWFFKQKADSNNHMSNRKYKKKYNSNRVKKNLAKEASRKARIVIGKLIVKNI